MENYSSLTDLKGTRVVFDRETYSKIMHWVHKAPGEVSGLGTVQILEDGAFFVTSAVLLPQKNSGSSTDIEGEDVAKAMFLLKDAPGTLNFWWHSHVHMGVFWSKTDTDTIQEFGNSGGHGGFLVSTVFNKKNEHRTAVYLSTTFDGKPFKMFEDEVPSTLMTHIKPEVIEGWDKEYDKNCKSSYDFSNWKDRKKGKNHPPCSVLAKEKLLGECFYQNEKWAVDLMGNSYAGPIGRDAEFAKPVWQRVLQSNEKHIKKFLEKDFAYWKQLVSELSLAQLDHCFDIGTITEDEYYEHAEKYYTKTSDKKEA